MVGSASNQRKERDMAQGCYDSLSPIQADLLKLDRIDIMGDIEGNTAVYVRDALMRLTARGSPDITITITSPGGSVGVGLDICDALQIYSGKKNGLVMGYARSMAAIILQVCHRRMIARHGSIMIHHINRRSVSLDQLRSEEKRKKLLEEMEKTQARLYQILTNRTGHPIEKITAVCEEERDMTAEESKEFGLVDEIISPALPSGNTTTS